MKVMYIIQQSIYDKQRRWISADSNTNMYVGIVGELIKHVDWKFDVLVGNNFRDINSMEDLLKDDKIKYINNPYPVDSVMSRYTFNFEWYVDILNKVKPDIIWNNISEISRNLYSLTKYLEINCKIISCNYWIDAPAINEGKVPDKRQSYALRQIDGALAADLVPFTCESTRNIFICNMQETLTRGDTVNEVKNKSTIWDFGFSKYELEKYRIDNNFDKITILFPNRLSGINYTHHEEFIEAVNDLYNERKDFQVIFTNPTQKISWEFLKNNVNPLFIYSEDILSRKKYIELLWTSDIVVNLYDIERYGGCCNVEAMYCNCIPVMTKYGEYKMRVSSDYPLFVELPVTSKKIKNVLNKALDIYKNIELDKSLIDKSSYEESYKVVCNDIRRIMSG